MKIRLKKSFEKQYKKLRKLQKTQVNTAIETLMINPQNKNLNNHRLKGSLKGKQAISAAFDLRIVFIQTDKYIELLGVGTHNQVY